MFGSGGRGGLVRSLLQRVGTEHPQALVYPLTVASNSSDLARRNAADEIMRHMQRCSRETATIVVQAKQVSKELIRVAILWHELWHEGLEKASQVRGCPSLLYPPFYLSTRLPTYLPAYPRIYLPTFLPTFPPTYLCTRLSSQLTHPCLPVTL